MKKKWLAVPLAILLGAAGCAGSQTETTETTDTTTAEATQTVSDEDMFTDRDYETSYEDAVEITLSDAGSASADSSVQIDGSTVTITAEGTYLLSGTLTDGQIVVNADDTAKVQIVLDGASVHCEGSAALYVVSADKVFVTTAEGSENTLASTGEFVSDSESNVDGAIFSRSDLTLNGEGLLTVECETGHGIVSKDDLKITSGTYVITAEKSGLQGKDSVRIADGDITITAGTDGIHAENTEDASLGFLYILNGTITIHAGNDGLDASGTLTVVDGTLDITTSSGASASTQQNGMPAGGPGRQSTQSTSSAASGTTAYALESTTSDSMKALKSDTAVVIEGGTFTIHSAEDGVHSNGSVTIEGGSLEIAATDDGIHAEEALTVSGGTVRVTMSYEGLEATDIVISGGTVSVTSSDDGFNASSSTSEPMLTISGGTVYVNAGGDGLDSNGNIEISGGTIVVAGPTNDGNGTLDSADQGGTITVDGGLLIAYGSSGMVEYPSASSSQYSIGIGLSVKEGELVYITDESGNVIAAFEAQKSFASLIVSSEEFASGQTITVYTGGSASGTMAESGLYEGASCSGGTQAASLTLSSTVTTYGSGGTGAGMGPRR